MQYDDGVRGEGCRGCYPGPSGAGCCANAAGFRACRRSPPGPAPQAVPATTYPGEAGGKTGAEAGRKERKTAGISGETCVTYDRCGEGPTAWRFSCCCPTWGDEASSPRGCGTGGGDSRIDGTTSAWRGNTWRSDPTSGDDSGGHTTWGPAGNTHSPRCGRARRSSARIRGATCGNAESNTSEGGTPDGATSCGSTPSSHGSYRTGRTWGFGAEDGGPGGHDPGNGTSTRRKATRSYAANGQAPCRCSPGGETTNSHPTRSDAPWVEACGIARRKASRGKTPGGATARRQAAGSEAADGEITNDTA